MAAARYFQEDEVTWHEESQKVFGRLSPSTFREESSVVAFQGYNQVDGV